MNVSFFSAVRLTADQNFGSCVIQLSPVGLAGQSLLPDMIWPRCRTDNQTDTPWPCTFDIRTWPSFACFASEAHIRDLTSVTILHSPDTTLFSRFTVRMSHGSVSSIRDYVGVGITERSSVHCQTIPVSGRLFAVRLDLSARQ